MNLFKKFVLGASALGLVATGVAAQALRSDASAPGYQQVESLARGYVERKAIPGIAIAIGRGGDAPAFVSQGRLVTEASGAAVDPDSLWRVYSMTKPITGIAAMMLIEDGKLKLDQPISDFIPGFKDAKVLTDPANSLASRPAARAITVRHLLTHTAGLGYTIVTKGPLLKEYERLGINPASVNGPMEASMRAARPATLEEFANRTASLPLIADPGTKWSYSISLDILARVIEVAGGMPYEQFLQTRLFGPLKMNDSFFTVPAGKVNRLVTNYVFMGQNMGPLDPGVGSVFASAPSFPYGGAGLVMSARDYDRFLAMLLARGTLEGRRVMKPETVALAMSNLLPAGVAYTSGPAKTPTGFGAGGSVSLSDTPGGPGKGTYGWGGAAGTIAFVDPANNVRGTVMVNYFPSEQYPLRQEFGKALYADIAR